MIVTLEDSRLDRYSMLPFDCVLPAKIGHDKPCLTKIVRNERTRKAMVPMLANVQKSA